MYLIKEGRENALLHNYVLLFILTYNDFCIEVSLSFLFILFLFTIIQELKIVLNSRGPILKVACVFVVYYALWNLETVD